MSQPGVPLDADIDGPRPGWFAVSVNALRQQDLAYAYFLQLQPVAMAGYSIYIYHVDVDDANRLRKMFGLKEIADSGNSSQ